MRKRLTLVALLGMAAVGCSAGDLDGTIGQLGEGVFRYGCVEDGDARCNETDAIDSFEVSTTLGIDPELPLGVAVGARFDLTYVGDTIDDGEVIVVDVEPARTDLVTHAAGFTIQTDGKFAFLARNAAKQRVVDFIHIDAFRIAALDVWHQEDKVSSLDLNATDETHLAVVAVAEGNIALAGALPFEWQSSDETVVAIGEVGSSDTLLATATNEDEVRIVALAEGTATLTVTQGDMSQEIAVTVGPEVTP